MNMVEQVAREVSRSLVAAGGPHMDIFTCIEVARAAIEAMREPTAAMVEAGVTADHGKTLGQRVTNSHRAMIDAALN